MQPTIIKLSEGQYLSEVEPFKSSGIPNNCILYKEVTGCGATSSELFTERNSIIIVPHVPVIKDKVRVHNKQHGAEMEILGIHKDIEDVHIENYLNSKAVYKKLLTTPEGFKKVLRVFENDIDTLLKEYFMLFDECERIITDVSYRGAIAAPIEWFTCFENKALVSATPLEFSHPVLAALDRYEILPDYDFTKDIKVIGTNNVIESLEKVLLVERSKPVFLFVNSTNCIIDIIKTLQLADKSHVYCGERSIATLASNKFKKAYSDLDLKNLAQYNFLTSRYFSALDIKLDYKPDIIMVTDVHTARHSILDPHTEIIQIAGRFRNGLNSVTHVTNFIADLESKSVDESKYYLKGCFDTYEHILKLFKSSEHPGSQDTLKFFVENSPATAYYRSDGEINDFMVDNFIHEQRVGGYYRSLANLQTAYTDKQLHFNPNYGTEQYLLGDNDRINRKGRMSIKEQQRETFRQIDRFKAKPGSYILHNSHTLISNLRSLYPALTEVYDLIGLDGMEKANFVGSAMQQYKKAAQEIKDLKHLAPYVYSEFNSNTERSDEELKTLIPMLCKKANVKLRAMASLLSRFYETSRTTKLGQHITNIKEQKNLADLSPFD